MRSVRALAIVGLLLSCGPQSSSVTPSDPVASATPADAGATPQDGAETPAEQTPAAEETPAAEAPAAETPAAETPAAETPAAETPAAETPAAETPPAGDPKPVVATLDLPRPIHGKVEPKCGRDAGVGERLKSFSLPGLGDKKVTSGTFKGRVQVVNFWGTWCKPCLKELPEFDQLYRRYRKHGMTLLAIATDEDAEAVRATVTSKKLGAKIAIAGEDYANQYGSPKFPFTFVVDHKGVIRGSYRGYKPECMGKLEADIREQLQVRAEARAKRKSKKKKG